MNRGPRKASTRSVLGALANAADDYGFCCPEITQLADQCCCSEETVMRQISKLETDGWIEVRRKVLSGRRSVYFIDLRKLGLTERENGRRSPLWRDIERLLKALESGGKVTRGQGILQLEKAAQDGEIPTTRPLFEEDSDENSPVNLTGGNSEFDGEDPPNLDEDGPYEGKINDLQASAAAAVEFPTVILPPVTRQNDSCQVTKSQVSGDSASGVPLIKVLNVTNPLTLTPPQPPRGSGLVLPNPGCRPGEADFALNVGIAARWVMGRIGATAKGLERAIASQLSLRMTTAGDALAVAASLMAHNYGELYRAHEQGLLGHAPWALGRFIGEGLWQDQAKWPWKPEAVRRPQPGVAEAKSAEQMAAESKAAAERWAAFTEANAKQVEELKVPEAARYALQPVIDDLRETARLLRENVIAANDADKQLGLIEQQMIALLIEHVPAAAECVATVDERMKALPETNEKHREHLRRQMVRRQVCDACDAPFLSLAYAPSP